VQRANKQYIEICMLWWITPLEFLLSNKSERVTNKYLKIEPGFYTLWLNSLNPRELGIVSLWLHDMAKKMGIIWVWLGGSTMDNLPNSWRVTPSTSRSGELTTYVTPTCKLNPSPQTPPKGKEVVYVHVYVVSGGGDTCTQPQVNYRWRYYFHPNIIRNSWFLQLDIFVLAKGVDIKVRTSTILDCSSVGISSETSVHFL